MRALKLYETKDASLNISVEFNPFRFLFGAAYTEALMRKDVGMRMVTIHLPFLCLSFTRFFAKVEE